MSSNITITCLSDYEQHARSTMSEGAFVYYSGGAEDEITVKENANAFKRYQIIPRVLRDVSKREIGTTILGHPISFPVCISPTAFHKLAHPDGEVATARGAMSMNVGYTMSSYASRSIDDVADAAGECLKFMQVQFFSVLDVTLNIIKSAESRGFQAVILTVDVSTFGKRSSWLRLLPSIADNKSKDPADFLRYPNIVGHLPTRKNNFLFDASTTWKDVQWLITQTRLPVILKGILSPEDAVLAVEAGAAGILVSNHGGRQLDSVPATIDVLPDIVKAVDGRCEVYLDGGIRRGTDILKALALGARAVFIGRPVIYALCHKGEEGVHNMLDILKDEFSTAMALSGCTSVDEIRKTVKLRNILQASHF